MTPEQEQAVRQVRQCYVYTEYESLFEQLISQLSQTQSALEQAQAERDTANHNYEIAVKSKIEWMAQAEQAQRERDEAVQERNLCHASWAQAEEQINGLIKQRDELQAKLTALQQEQVRQIAIINRLGTWAQQDPTGPWIKDDIQRWLLDQLEQLGGSRNPPSTQWKPITQQIEEWQKEKKELQAKLAHTERERDELEAIFDLRHNADMRAIKAWRAAHPGSELIMPDHVDLAIWLAEQLETK